MSHLSLVRLKRQARRYGVTQDEIAVAADVGRSLVSHVLAGRAKSSNVVGATRRLVAAHATGWAGNDLEARLAEVSRSRSRTRV